MSAIAAYMVKSILLSGILYFYYQLFLKNKSFHSFNRFYLLAVFVISTIGPLISIELERVKIDSSPLYSFLEKTGPTVAPPGNVFSTMYFWILTGSFIISLYFLVAIALKIRWIYRVKRASRITKSDGFTFIETYVQQAPFSFFNNLFWKQGLSLSDPNGERIFRHELTHIKQKHTYDRLFSQLLSGIFWINPFYWLLQKELITVHEFIADDVAVGDGDAAAFAGMLLYSHNSGSYLSPSHHFFNSQIKRRLKMVNSSKTTPYASLRKLFVFPVALAVTFALSLDSEAQTTPVSQTSAERSAQDSNPKKSQEVITVTGYSKKKGKPSTTAPASQESLKPVTVTGKKSGRKSPAKQEEKKAF